jgi:signal peptidase II
VLGVVALDQATKLWILDYLADRPTVSVLGNFFRLTLVYNFGGAMGTQLGPSIYYLIMALVVLPIVLLYIYRHRTERIIALPLSFIAGGAIGNMIDRIYLGKVVDFLDFDIPNIDFLGFTLNRFWAFNVADAAITCSIAFLIVRLMFFHHEPASAEQGERPDPE